MIDHLILFGSTGMLGRYVYSFFKNHSDFRLTIIQNDEFRVSYETLDRIDELLVTKQIGENTCVINCIGQIPQRTASSASMRNYYLINSLFPHLLWTSCKRYGAKMIQPTTDCVFSGTRGFYTENDTHDEQGAYGISKSLGEPNGCTVIRTSIIGNELYNKKSLLEWVLSNDNKTINGWVNHTWNGITCLEYCKIIEKIIKRNMLWKGVHHIASPTPVNKYELSVMIRNVYNCNIIINPISTETNVDKTLNTVYTTNSDLEIPALSVQLKELRTFVLLE